MKRRKIKEYVKTLSKEEQIQFKDLIKECEERENNIIKNSEITKNNIDRWANKVNQNNEKLILVSEALNKLKNEITKLYLREVGPKSSKEVH